MCFVNIIRIADPFQIWFILKLLFVDFLWHHDHLIVGHSDVSAFSRISYQFFHLFKPIISLLVAKHVLREVLSSEALRHGIARINNTRRTVIVRSVNRVNVAALKAR